MRLIDTPHGIRFGLYVFVFLIVFCVAQLTWWIIYQIELNRQIYENRIALLHLKAETYADRINNDFQRMSDLAGYAARASGGNRSELEQCFNNLLSDKVVVGYQLWPENAEKTASAGEFDSTFYVSSEQNYVLYFDPQYPESIIAIDSPDLIFAPHPRNDGRNGIWVTADMFQIMPDVQQRIESESRKGLKMFVFEGSFFMLVVLFGAYLIYRTLQKSEDLKVRQANFIHGVTHEFRTPLTSLRLYLETLESGKLESSQADSLYGKMLDDCDRLDSMVDNVLEAGHFGREKYELKLTETDLSTDVQEYLDGLKPFLDRRHAHLTTHIEENVRIRSDYHALGRAIRAVVDNAIKYSPPDRREIMVSLNSSGKSAVVRITDKGIGISPEEREKVFDRFYRVTDKDRKTVKGTGLGLYLVRQIVQAHGGKVEIVSKGADKGSSVIIKLPVVRS